MTVTMCEMMKGWLPDPKGAAVSGALVEGTTLAFLGLCAAGQRPACDGELDGAVRWRVRGGECDDLFSAMVQLCI